MRIANIIIAHKNPLQLERLIMRMQHPNFDFYIHIDKKVNIEQFDFLRNIPGVYFIENRINCTWAGFSTLQAMIGTVTEVLNKGYTYLFYNLLSAQDYPLKTSDELYQFFLANSNHSYIYYETEESSDWWKTAVDRYQRYHLTEYTFTGKFVIENLINKIMPARKFPLSVKLYGGSKASWWMLNHSAATYVVDFFKNKLSFKRFLKFCWGTDEFVIPTVLMNSPLRNTIVNNNYRYIDFSNGGGNPKILRMEDWSHINQSEMFFARKFDEAVDTSILDQIDESLQH